MVGFRFALSDCRHRARNPDPRMLTMGNACHKDGGKELCAVTLICNLSTWEAETVGLLRI